VWGFPQFVQQKKKSGSATYWLLNLLRPILTQFRRHVKLIVLKLWLL
jgi:hypothetical protein